MKMFSNILFLCLIVNLAKLEVTLDNLESDGENVLIGFDCTSAKTQRAIVSLVNMKPCTNNTGKASVNTFFGQVIQPKIRHIVKTKRCLASYTRSIFRCGYWIENVVKGSTSGVIELNEKECSRLIEKKKFVFNNLEQENLLPNTYNKFQATVIGQVNGEGKCTGGETMILDGVTYTFPIVQYAFSVYFSEEMANVDIKKNRIYFSSGLTCDYFSFDCMTSDGQYFWEKIYGQSTCTPSELYELLYEGHINETVDSTGHYFSVFNDRISFTLGAKGKTTVCNHPGIQSEFPDIVILKRQDNIDFPLRRKDAPVNTENIDIVKYIIAKNMQLERRMDNSFISLSNFITYTRCMTNRKVIQNLLSIAKIDPLEFSYQYTGGQGYTAINRGEVIYVLKCVAKPVKLRRTLGCYQEIPVVYNNQSFFLTPKYRTIQDTGSKIPCHSMYKPMFRVGEEWIGIEEGFHEAKPPQELDPNDDLTWNYSLPMSRKTGLYSIEDLMKFKEYIMTASRQQSIANNFINSIADGKDMRITNSFSNKDFDKIEESIFTGYYTYLLKKLSLFGEISSIFISIVIIWKSLQWLISVILNGKLIYSLVGFSWKLLIALSDACSSFYLHKKSNPNLGKNKGKNRNLDEEDEKTTSVLIELEPKNKEERSSELRRPIFTSSNK